MDQGTKRTNLIVHVHGRIRRRMVNIGEVLFHPQDLIPAITWGPKKNFLLTENFRRVALLSREGGRPVCTSPSDEQIISSVTTMYQIELARGTDNICLVLGRGTHSIGFRNT